MYFQLIMLLVDVIWLTKSPLKSQHSELSVTLAGREEIKLFGYEPSFDFGLYDVSAIEEGARNAGMLRRCLLYSCSLQVVSFRIQRVKNPPPTPTLEPGITLLC